MIRFNSRSHMLIITLGFLAFSLDSTILRNTLFTQPPASPRHEVESPGLCCTSALLYGRLSSTHTHIHSRKVAIAMAISSLASTSIQPTPAQPSLGSLALDLMAVGALTSIQRNRSQRMASVLYFVRRYMPALLYMGTGRATVLARLGRRMYVYIYL